MAEITSEEQNKAKRMKRTEDSLRDLWDHIKHTNIWIIEVPNEEKKKGYEKYFEEITVEIFPNTEKEIANQVQEAQRVPYRINPRRNMPRHILIKLTKTIHKQRVLKTAREKQQVTYKGNRICLTADLSEEILQTRGNGRIYLKYWKGKIYNQDYCTWQGPHSKLMEKKLYRLPKLRESVPPNQLYNKC